MFDINSIKPELKELVNAYGNEDIGYMKFQNTIAVYVNDFMPQDKTEIIKLWGSLPESAINWEREGTTLENMELDIYDCIKSLIMGEVFTMMADIIDQ